VAFEYAARILSLSGELEARLREMGRQASGPLLIGASTTLAEYLLPQVLGEFKSLHPGVMPRLFVANSEAVQERVAARSLDLGFIEGDSHLPSLANDLFCQDELRVVCAPGHALAKAEQVVPRMLLEHAYVSREPGSGTREVVDHYLQKAGLAPDLLQVVMEAGSPEALKGVVATGLGFAIMSRATTAKEVRLGELIEIALAPPLVRQLSVVYPKERFQSRLVEGFVRFAKERLAAGQAPGASSGAAPRPAASAR
jgi:DNA-binding transcriptional LysR family regulator